MIPFKWTRSLWFFQPAINQATSIELSVSATYNVTTSVYPVGSVDVDMSAFTYPISASAVVEILASVDYTGEVAGPLSGFLTITPVYVLDISGQNDASTSVSYPLSISGSAFLQIGHEPSVTYPLSVSISATLLTINSYDVAFVGTVSAVMNFTLLKAAAQLDVNVVGAYGITASSQVTLVTPSPGGLVFSKKKGRYVPVRVANAG